MCMFSGPVRHVGGTRIFARPLDDGRQALAYAMRVSQEQALAMILPLPVPAGSPEDAVEFVDLSSAADLFDDLEGLFVRTMAIAASRGGPSTTLQVHHVGAFEASFVPSVADFARLDPAFRLPPRVWDKLPQYADHGFCVFALRPLTSERPGLFQRIFRRNDSFIEPHEVHPMGFVFPRRTPDEVFFPTLHVHDGQVHRTATFDHTLYLQSDAADAARLDWSWEMSAYPAEPTSPAAETMVRPGRRVYRRALRGELPNRDLVSSATADARRTRIHGPCAVQVDPPWKPADAALLDEAAAALGGAAAALGAPVRAYDPVVPAVSAEVATMHGRLNLRTEARTITLEHVLADGRLLRGRVTVHHNPGLDGCTALTTALARFA